MDEVQLLCWFLTGGCCACRLSGGEVEPAKGGLTPWQGVVPDWQPVLSDIKRDVKEVKECKQSLAAKLSLVKGSLPLHQSFES